MAHALLASGITVVTFILIFGIMIFIYEKRGE